MYRNFSLKLTVLFRKKKTKSKFYIDRKRVCRRRNVGSNIDYIIPAGRRVSEIIVKI